MQNRKWFHLVTLYGLLAACPEVSAHQLRVQIERGETIHESIAKCRRGDTLIIPSGTYLEPALIIDKPVCILGENFPILDGQAKYDIIDIRSDSVTIRGLKLQNPGHSDVSDMAALKISGAKNITIRSNVILNAYFAIYLQRASECLIYNNYIQGAETSETMTGNGIHCWQCNELRIFQNTITSQRDGIYFEFVTNSIVLGNNCFDNIRYGLHFMFSHNDRYISNIFRNNGAGVAVMYTKHVAMLYNQFLFNMGPASYGLLLKDISDSEIIGNRFEENTIAVRMEGSNRIMIRNNNFYSNGWAAQVQASCMDNVFTSNNFTGNTFDVSTNGDLVLNSFDENYWDKYEGYDIDRDGLGDVPYHPVGLYSVIVENVPTALILYRSPITTLMDKAEEAIPAMTPVELVDHRPLMKFNPRSYD